MSLNAMHRNVMDFSDSQQKAEEKLQELINQLDEEILVRKKDFVKTVSKVYQARRFSDYCRGYRYREVYVDYSLSNPETMNLITMKLVPPHYYTNEPYDENYNWRDHVHYF